MRRAARVTGVGLTLALTLSGCAYYNAMWTAERFAKEARRLEASGREPEARVQWSRAAVKAESVLVRHPRSRWADDALVLWGEGLARAGTCRVAAAPIAKALATVSDAGLHERAGLAAAQCALTMGKPVEAEQALAEALASNDARRRSRAEYLAGQGAVSRFEFDVAVAHFLRSREPAALPARVRALLAAGRAADAAALLDTVARGGGGGRLNEGEWAELLDGLARAGGGDAASAALDRMLARARVPSAERARLLIADGDRRLGRGDLDGATARYRQAAAAAPMGGDAGVARAREQRVLVARAAGPADLHPIVAELTRMSRPGGAGGDGGARGSAEARTLLDLVARVVATPETPGGAFRVAELARDSLSAPRLAGQLFLNVATRDSGSLFAPKALVAALALLPDRHDSIVSVLDHVYAASPYTRALRGEASPAYAAAEDSLAHELGVQVARVPPAAAARSNASSPITGPRGPWLDDAPSRGRASPPAPSLPALRPRADEPGRRAPTAPTPPPAPPPRDRPVARPDPP